MTGGKTLGQVRAELEAALGTGPAGKGEVAESLRWFLAAGSVSGAAPNQPQLQRTAGSSRGSTGSGRRPGRH